MKMKEETSISPGAALAKKRWSKATKSDRYAIVNALKAKLAAMSEEERADFYKQRALKRYVKRFGGGSGKGVSTDTSEKQDKGT